MVTSYHGYLACHIELIRDLHGRGASTRAIAIALYDAGARAHTSSPYSSDLDRAGHVTNLRGMVIYVQQRLQLRVRHVRVLNLKANESGRRPGDEPRRANSKMLMISKERPGGTGQLNSRADTR